MIHTRALRHNPKIYLINMISPIYACCHQHQNMIKGMIALSISPFLVVDDNIHALLNYNKTLNIEGVVVELPLTMCIKKCEELPLRFIPKHPNQKLSQTLKEQHKNP